MLQKGVAEIRHDAEQLLEAVGNIDKVGLCCINMDFGTPDENVREAMKVASDYSIVSSV
jgi:hypothetical protein